MTSMQYVVYDMHAVCTYYKSSYLILARIVKLYYSVSCSMHVSVRIALLGHKGLTPLLSQLTFCAPVPSKKKCVTEDTFTSLTLWLDVARGAVAL